MKMKKIYLLSLLMLGLAGCELETEVYDKINPTVFPKNASDAKALVTASAYNVFNPQDYDALDPSKSNPGIFNIAWGYTLTSDMSTDHVECSWEWTTVYNSYDGDDWHVTGDTRAIYYFIKYLSSMCLTKDRIKDVNMSQDLKDRYNAELDCGMGFLAFLLYDLYGPIPVADLETLKAPGAEKILPRLSEEKMREYIESNLLAARKVLPYKYDESEYGRFTKGLANTVLMKFYMMIGEYAKAEEVGRELQKSEYGYKLVNDYNSIFTLSGERNTETIFAVNAKRGYMETQWFAHVLPNDFPTAGDIQKWGGYKISWPFYWTYESGDSRLQRLFGEYTTKDGLKHNYTNDRERGTNTSVMYYGAIPMKYKEEGVVGYNCEIDMPIYRYADVLTLLAEAIVRNGNKLTQEAVNLLNEVRTRSLPGKGYQLNDFPNTEAFLDKLLEERGHEFYMEGVRRQDLIRHGKFIEFAIKKAEFAGKPTGKIATQVNGHYKYERFPLPAKVINEGMGLIEQNPGY